MPEALRGTYAGLAHPAAVAHLQRLGVTAVELLPVHQFVHDAQLVQRGLRNYWGYQSIGYFAPHNGYASADGGGQVDEFRQMVRALHAAGLEVILDVVFNHTAEGDQWGPTLCFRGIDNAAYYRLQDDRSRYVDDTGCGNTVNVVVPQTLRLVMDALRYWVQEMHVDGFRFDLAASLGRGVNDFDPSAAFLEAVGQDPVLSQVKLIAEPWDIGAYDLGAFPAGWSEWNGKYRDTVRDFWRSTPGTLPDLATRISGSRDLYGHGGRRPSASVNILTVHDGFTLADLVSYDGKHNEANGEDNRDGTDDNRSWNCGVEGPTDDPAVLELRARQRRNFLATLLLSEGVPLLLGGDEFARSQSGNNNAYCHDDELTWFDWSLAAEHSDLVDFTAGLCRLRREHPVFRRRQFLLGRPAHAAARDDLDWYRPDGGAMTPQDWSASYARAVTMALSGDTGVDARPDDPFLTMLNAWWEPLELQRSGRAARRHLAHRGRHRRPGQSRFARRPLDHGDPERALAAAAAQRFLAAGRRRGQRDQQFAHTVIGDRRVAQGPVRIDAIVVPRPDPLAHEIPLVAEVGQHAVGVAVCQPDAPGDLAHRQVGVARHLDQHGPVRADQRPVALPGHLRRPYGPGQGHVVVRIG